MTPQERKLIAELFDRLASLEDNSRDPDAVQAINDGLDRAPNALYALVQSVLVQDEALKRADARIRELEDELGISSAPSQQQSSFLDSMRDNMRGRREQQGSVPSVRPGAPQAWNDAPEEPAGSPWRTTRLPPQGSQWNASGPPPSGAPWNAPQGQPQPQPGSPGGSFLGTAAAAAVGAVGGTLLTNSLKGMFGGQQGQAHAALDPGSKPGSSSSPNAAGGELSREAGLNDVSRSGSSRVAANENPGESQRTGLLNTAQNDAEGYEDDSAGDDTDDDVDLGDDDTDTA